MFNSFSIFFFSYIVIVANSDKTILIRLFQVSSSQITGCRETHYMISLWQGTTPFMWAKFDLLTKLKLVFRRAFTKQTKSFWVWKVSNHCKPSNLALWCFNYFLSSLLVANVLNLKKDVIQNKILQRDFIMKVTFKDFFSNGEYIWVFSCVHKNI